MPRDTLSSFLASSSSNSRLESVSVPPRFLLDPTLGLQLCPAHCFLCISTGVSQDLKSASPNTVCPSPKPAHPPCFSPAVNPMESPEPES